MKSRFAIAPLLLFLLVETSLLAQGGQAPPLTGPHAIGRTVVHFVDESREEIWTDDPNDHREMTVVIWYPAEPSQAAVSSYIPKLGETMPPALIRIQEDARKFKH